MSEQLRIRTAGTHALEQPKWFRSREYERFPAGGGYSVSCSCGWRSQVETTSSLAQLQANRHLLDQGESPLSPPPARHRLRLEEQLATGASSAR